MNSGAAQILTLIITTTFLMHVVACFWFMGAKFADFGPETWPARTGYVYKTSEEQYLLCLYWALQTLTTVGFGDIGGKTVFERIFCCCWMLAGIAFYSFAIGNMSNLIASMDKNTEELNRKLGVLKQFRVRTQMPIRFYNKIKRHLETNQNS